MISEDGIIMIYYKILVTIISKYCFLNIFIASLYIFKYCISVHVKKQVKSKHLKS
jgi:hypothetical protein